jgi:signal transduction histidine kinase
MINNTTKPARAPLLADRALATLAHELRNPLAAILFVMEALPDNLDSDVRRAQSIALHEVRKAARIVDDLYDLCAASAGQLPLRKEVVELETIVTGATETMAHLIAARRQRLTVSLPSSQVFLFADPFRLEQVLTNLLVNATKYTEPEGDIRLTAVVDARQVVLGVRDNGRGIAADRLPWVFDQFWHGSDEHAEGGLGLGLTLVKSLVELHGGSVEARSDGPGAGTEIIVYLPTWSGG